MSETQKTEAPFEFDRIRRSQPEWVLGWAARQRGAYTVGDNRQKFGGKPLFARVGMGDYAEFGVTDQQISDEDCYALAEHVYLELWPEPAPKPIWEMTEEECKAAARELGHTIIVICGSAILANPFRAVAHTKHIWSGETCGMPTGPDAARSMLRQIAKRVGINRYAGEATDTITPDGM